MKGIVNDLRFIREYSPKMNGIFSVPDLKNLLLEKEPVTANRGDLFADSFPGQAILKGGMD